MLVEMNENHLENNRKKIIETSKYSWAFSKRRNRMVQSAFYGAVFDDLSCRYIIYTCMYKRIMHVHTQLRVYLID
jgi:hypothetical protein